MLRSRLVSSSRHLIPCRTMACTIVDATSAISGEAQWYNARLVRAFATQPKTNVPKCNQFTHFTHCRTMDKIGIAATVFVISSMVHTFARMIWKPPQVTSSYPRGRRSTWERHSRRTSASTVLTPVGSTLMTPIADSTSWCIPTVIGNTYRTMSYLIIERCSAANPSKGPRSQGQQSLPPIPRRLNPTLPPHHQSTLARPIQKGHAASANQQPVVRGRGKPRLRVAGEHTHNHIVRSIRKRAHNSYNNCVISTRCEEHYSQQILNTELQPPHRSSY